jgi:hypothetical protein
VDATTSFIVSGMENWPVDLVLYDNGQTRLVKAEIESPTPLRLKLIDAKAANIRPGRRVMLLAKQDSIGMRGDGHLDEVRRGPEGVHLDISQVHWELLERRRHVRVPVYLPISIRTVVENREAPAVDIFSGTTIDLSISGALVNVSPLPIEGSLVEMQANLNGENVRVLAVVAHAAGSGTGLGLHFVEYLDNARFHLQTFLSQAA